MSKCPNSESVLKTINFSFAQCFAHEQSNLLSPQFTAPMAFQTAGARHIASLQGKPRNPAEHLWNFCGTLVEPCGTLVESLRNSVEPCETSPQGRSGPSHSPRRTSWNPGGALVECSWNLASNHPGPPRRTLWNPARTLVELYGTLPRRTWWNAGGTGTLVEPWWNPRGTLPQGHPGPPRSLSGLRPQSFQLLGNNNSPVGRYLFFSRGSFKQNPAVARWLSRLFLELHPWCEADLVQPLCSGRGASDRNQNPKHCTQNVGCPAGRPFCHFS